MNFIYLVCFMKIVFSIHLKERLDFRKISEEEVIDTIRFPFHITKNHGKHFYQKKLQRGMIEVCCEITERDIKVITVYWV